MKPARIVVATVIVVLAVAAIGASIMIAKSAYGWGRFISARISSPG